MPRFVLVFIIGFLMVGVFPARVFAAGEATFSITPPRLTVTEGEVFTMQVMVDPNQESLDTVRLFLDFSSNIVRIDEAVLNGDFGRSSPGNSIDNEQGSFSYGGFTLEGPVTESGPFLLLTLTAQSAGEANLTVLDTSRLIRAGEERANARGHESASVTVDPAASPVPEERVETVVTEEGASQEQVFQTLAGIEVTSATHPDPDSWWPSTKVQMNWKPATGVTVNRYFLSFDNDPVKEPTESVGSDQTTTVQEAEKEGIWYFHLAAELTDGSRTPTLHRSVKIDATPPNTIVPDLSERRLTEGGSIKVTFGTTDDLSGVDHYELSVNKQGFTPAESPVTMPDLEAGDYFVEVKAMDRAGNERYGFDSFRVYTKGVLEAEEKRTSLLITYVLAVALVFAIIYAMWRKKRVKKI
jgi:hypothetical protein